MWHAWYEGSVVNVHVSPHCDPQLGALEFCVQQIMRFVLMVKFRDRRRMSLRSSLDCSQPLIRLHQADWQFHHLHEGTGISSRSPITCSCTRNHLPPCSEWVCPKCSTKGSARPSRYWIKVYKVLERMMNPILTSRGLERSCQNGDSGALEFYMSIW